MCRLLRLIGEDAKQFPDLIEPCSAIACSVLISRRFNVNFVYFISIWVSETRFFLTFCLGE